MPSVIQNYLLQALTKKQNIWFIAITIYDLDYLGKEKIFSTNLQDVNGYMRSIEECPQNKPMYIPYKSKNDKTYVTWQEELC